MKLKRKIGHWTAALSVATAATLASAGGEDWRAELCARVMTMTDAEYNRYCDDLAARHPDWIRVSSIGDSREGRRITLLTVTDFSTGAAESKPAYFIQGGIHSRELSGALSALYVARRLAEDPRARAILKRFAFYVIPRCNPDGSERMVREPGDERSAWGDYVDWANTIEFRDLDGDGAIRFMRWEDPDGSFVKSPKDDRCMLRRTPDSKGPCYRLMNEGVFRNWDGKTTMCTEYWRTYFDMNRNWPQNWDARQYGCGRAPLDQVENARQAEWILAHTNLVGATGFHNGYGMVFVHPVLDADRDRYFRAARRFGELIGIPVFDRTINRFSPESVPRMTHGRFQDWCYEVAHLPTYIIEVGTRETSAGMKTMDFYGMKDHNPYDAPYEVYAFEDRIGLPDRERSCVGWRKVRHPQLGEVEVGGRCGALFTNPLAPEIERMAEAAFVGFRELAEELVENGRYTGFHQPYPELDAGQNALYNEIEAPLVVGVPPTYATRDLCILPDGRIRHYGHDVIRELDVVDGKKVPVRRTRPVYVESRDLGLSWTKHFAEAKDPGAMVRSPWSGDYLNLLPGGHGQKLRSVRSKKGPGDTEAIVREIDIAECNTREPLALRGKRRWIVPLSDISGRDETYHAAVAISDDDGRTWRRVDPAKGVDLPKGPVAPDEIPRWKNDACEPTVVELSDGTLLMAVRTSLDHHYLYRSKDFGDTWTGPEKMEGFRATGTMPFYLRLRDGRILFVWNNSVPLPRRKADISHPITDDEKRGRWETVFTNRDVLHAAISEDDGRTWRGFREILLNPIRNRPDFREYLGKDAENDKSVHQVQGLELSGGKVLLAVGQNPASRRLVVFDPCWLYESDAELDLREGLEGVSNQLYVRSVTGGCKWGGHCSWERLPGAVLEVEPDQADILDARESLHVCHIRDPRLVDSRQGVVWNFPASRRGRVETECRVDGEGFRLSLAEAWINPCDAVNAAKCAVSERITSETLGGAGKWVTLAVAWDLEKGTAVLSVDGRTVATRPIADAPRYGFSYLHVQSLSDGEDAKGSWFRGFRKTVKKIYLDHI